MTTYPLKSQQGFCGNIGLGMFLVSSENFSIYPKIRAFSQLMLELFFTLCASYNRKLLMLR